MGRKAEAYRGMVHMLFEEKITAQELLIRARIVEEEQMRLSLWHHLYGCRAEITDGTAFKVFVDVTGIT